MCETLDEIHAMQLANAIRKKRAQVEPKQITITQ